jgi:hypothetical protein
MEHDFMSRGYLLPKGCKDLIDALKLKACFLPQGYEHLLNISKMKPQVSFKFKAKQMQPPIPSPLPPLMGELVIPDQTTVAQLAALLGQKPVKIIADLMELGVFAAVSQLVDFNIVSDIARKYGYLAIKPS